MGIYPVYGRGETFIAKNALQLVKKLSKGITFNIVAMGDSLQDFQDNRRVEYNEGN